MRIRVGYELPTQDVADPRTTRRYDRIAASPHRRIAASPHRRIANRLIVGGKVQPVAAANVPDQRLLHRGQPPLDT